MTASRLCVAIGFALLAATVPTPSSANGPGGAGVDAGQPYVSGGNSAAAFTVRVVYPDGRISETQLLRNERLAIDPASPGGRLAEGHYQYEIRPIIGVANRSNSPNAKPLPRRPAISGGFVVSNGQVVLPSGPANPNSDRDDGTTGKNSVLAKDSVIPDDLIVQGSICTGFDCVNNENFGADTLVLKENNLRIYFNDTSSTGSFPSNDWRITANDQSSGGASYLSIDDATAGRTVVRVTAGAPANSLFIASSGNVGLGTSAPALDMHVNSGNTPAMRLEQDGSSGFTAQTWDIGANEANFFVRDVTNGSRLPFRIIPGAPTSSLYVDSDGDIGFGGTPYALSGFRTITARAGSTGSSLELTAADGERKGLMFYSVTGNFLNIGTAAGAGPILIRPEYGSGNVGISVASPTSKLDIGGPSIRIRDQQIPASANSACSTGEISWGPDFVYVCVGTNTWKRSALSSW